MHKKRTLLTLATLTATTMHVLNKLEYTHAKAKNILSSSENRYYEWRFGKIKYTVKGSGTPILLLHDLTVGSSSYEFYKIITSLSKKHEVYCIDFLGYGLSDKPKITYTNYLYVQLITDFIKNVIGKRTNIITSGDSFAAAVLACNNDDSLISSLIGINPQDIYEANAIPSNQTKLLKFLIETPVLGTFVYNLYSGTAAITKQFKENNFYNPNRINERDINAYVEAAHTPDHYSKYCFSSYLGKYMNTNIIHALKKINNNVCLIGGKEKSNIDTVLDNYVHYNSAIETALVSGTKQLPHLEKPIEIINLLDLYLN